MNFNEKFRKIFVGAAVVAGGLMSSEKINAQEKKNSEVEKPTIEQVKHFSKEQISESIEKLTNKLVENKMLVLDSVHYDGPTYVGRMGKYKVEFTDIENKHEFDAASGRVDIEYGDPEKEICYSFSDSKIGFYGYKYSLFQNPGLKEMNWLKFAEISNNQSIDAKKKVYANKLTNKEMQKILFDLQNVYTVEVQTNKNSEKNNLIKQKKRNTRSSF